jgi:hypothetical protein
MQLMNVRSKRVHEVLSVAPNEVGPKRSIPRDNRRLYFSQTDTEADIWVAAVAAWDGATVLTYDDHFRMIHRVGSAILSAWSEKLSKPANHRRWMLRQKHWIKTKVGKIDRLPSLPRVYSALITTLSQSDAPTADVVRILKQDIALCAKLLQLANSSFFQLAQRITGVERAVVYLGFNMVKNLVLSVELFQAAKSIPAGYSVDLLQRHSLATANLAARLLK